MIHKALKFLSHTSNSAIFHAVMAGLWLMLLFPTLMWWKESILWVATMSLYANFVGHLSAIEASLAKAKSNENMDR